MNVSAKSVSVTIVIQKIRRQRRTHTEKEREGKKNETMPISVNLTVLENDKRLRYTVHNYE